MRRTSRKPKRRTSRKPTLRRNDLYKDWDRVSFARRQAEKSGDGRAIEAAKDDERRVYNLMQEERSRRTNRNPVRRTTDIAWLVTLKVAVPGRSHTRLNFITRFDTPRGSGKPDYGLTGQPLRAMDFGSKATAAAAARTIGPMAGVAVGHQSNEGYVVDVVDVELGPLPFGLKRHTAQEEAEREENRALRRRHGSDDVEPNARFFVKSGERRPGSDTRRWQPADPALRDRFEVATIPGSMYGVTDRETDDGVSCRSLEECAGWIADVMEAEQRKKIRPNGRRTSRRLMSRTTSKQLRPNAMYLRAGMRVYAPARRGDQNAGSATVEQIHGETVFVDWDSGGREWIPVSRIERVERDDGPDNPMAIARRSMRANAPEIPRRQECTRCGDGRSRREDSEMPEVLSAAPVGSLFISRDGLLAWRRVAPGKSGWEKQRPVSDGDGWAPLRPPEAGLRVFVRLMREAKFGGQLFQP